MRLWNRLFWLAMYAAMVSINLPHFAQSTSSLRLKDHGRNGSVDTVLEQTLDLPKAAEQIDAWLANLPPRRAILVVTPPGNLSAAITADLFSYLAWPRRVDISSDAEELRHLLAKSREPYGAVGFCYQETPAGVSVSKSFGPALKFISPAAP